MKGDSYEHGRHFWVHFCCGIVVGGIIGIRFSWDLFDSFWACFGATAGITLVFALAVAYWGDPLWYWLLRIFGSRW
jgi:hypothetical protein